MVTDVNFLQNANVELFMIVKLLGKVTDVKPQPEKALAPMVVTLFGIVKEVKPVQLKNADSPMVVTLLGMVTVVTPEHL
jgi:hypothetical protein